MSRDETRFSYSDSACSCGTEIQTQMQIWIHAQRYNHIDRCRLAWMHGTSVHRCTDTDADISLQLQVQIQIHS